MTYKNSIYVCMFMCILMFFPSVSWGQVSFGTPERINEQWKFILGDPQGAQSTTYDDSKWEQVDLPHDWSVKQPLSPTLASCQGYLPGGIAWYRKVLNIPSDKKNEKVFLYFEGVYNRSEVFINGHSLGKRPNGYISFMYDATPYIKYGEENKIAVRVDHSKDADSRWYTGSGIYRDVWVVYSQPIHIAQWGVFVHSTVAKNKVTMHVDVEVQNETNKNAKLSLLNELFDTNGKLVAKCSEPSLLETDSKGNVNCIIHFNNPNLWSLDNPYLYTLKTSVLMDGKVMDTASTKTGVRTFTFNSNTGFALNGVNMKMKGVCIHHDAGVLGAAVPKEVWRMRLNVLKEIGCNAIRMSHNPQAPELYELCDEMGFLVLDEAFDEWEYAKRKWITGWNHGTPKFQGSFDFFKEWSDRDLTDLIRRDRNHASIFAWSIGNEVDYPNDPYSHPVLDGVTLNQPIYGGYQKDKPNAEELGRIAKRLVATAKRSDSSRPITAALAGVAMSNATEYPGALDIAGYNYTENMYAQDHKKYPERVIYGSENGQGYDAWKAVRDNSYIFGQFLWTGIDYLGESSPWPARGLNTGLVDLAGFIKPSGYFRQSLWSDKPMAYLGTYVIEAHSKQISQNALNIWNYRDGDLIRVVCYTNASQAKLLLNGKDVGTMKSKDDVTGIIYWDIPYEAGNLEVEAFDNNKKVASYSIVTTEAPYAITVNANERIVDKDNSWIPVVLHVVDSSGRVVMLSDNEITCSIDGDVELMGMDAGNNSDMGDYTDNKQRVLHGNLIVYLKSKGKAGEAKVRFTSPWLKGTTFRVILK